MILCTAAPQSAIILQIGKFQKLERQWVKHQRPLEMDMTVTFPASSDGVHVHKEVYKVAGMILHQAEAHSKGHSIANQCYDDICSLMTIKLLRPFGSQEQYHEGRQTWEKGGSRR